MDVSPLIAANNIKQYYKSRKYASEAITYFRDILPIKPSAELAAIAADLLTDGHIAVRKYYHSNKYAYIGFFSDEVSELDSFNLRVRKVFKILGKIKEWGHRKNGRSRGCIIIDARLARLLTYCGIPAGDKITKRYQIPTWILNGDENIKKAFLRRSFTCEGSIDKEKDGRWELRYTMHKRQDLSVNAIRYLEALRKLLREFNIKSYNISINDSYTRKRDGRQVLGFVLRIRDRQSLINYATYIGFDTKNKKRRLEIMFNQIK